MKQYILIFVVSLTALVFAGTPEFFAEKEIQPQLQILVDSLNSSDGDALTNIIAEDATPSVKEIPSRLAWNKIQYTIGNPEYDMIDGQHVKVTWKVASESSGVNGSVSINWLSHNAIFAKQNNVWKIVDGKFDPTTLWSVSWIFFASMGLIGWIFIILGIFWIFMLIHAAKNDIHNKIVWIIVLCLLGVPAAIAYFFTERRRFKKNWPMPTTSTIQ